MPTEHTRPEKRSLAAVEKRIVRIQSALSILTETGTPENISKYTALLSKATARKAEIEAES